MLKSRNPMHLRFSGLLATLAIAGVLPAAHAPIPSRAGENVVPPAAVLMTCSGKVTVIRAGGASAPGTFGLPLRSGDRVKAGRPPDAIGPLSRRTVTPS